MSGILVGYAVGPVHPRNLDRLREGLPGWGFRIVHEPALRGWRPEAGRSPVEAVELTTRHIPEAVWRGEVRALICSTVQPRPIPLRLLHEAMERRVPTIAIEEGHQLALTGRTVNNYVLPVDCLLAASATERDHLIAAGIAPERIDVTGWPFHHGGLSPIEPTRRRAAKQRLGLDPGRPVATLVLAALGDGGESLATRRLQLELVSRGLPPAFELLVKPHPLEPVARCRMLLAEHVERAHLVEGRGSIQDVLEATDVLVNRGASQVCLEALVQDIPVVVLETGSRTIFHDDAPESVVQRPTDLPGVLRQVASASGREQVYGALKARHLAPAPNEALALACSRIAAIATRGASEGPPRAAAWAELGLYEGWRGLRHLSRQALQHSAQWTGGAPVEVRCSRLVEGHASREDLKRLRDVWGMGFREHVLKALWIRRLDRGGEGLRDEDLSWLADFPPRENSPWFRQDVARWARLLVRQGCLGAVRALAARLGALAWVSGFRVLADDLEAVASGRCGRARYRWRRTLEASRRSWGVLQRTLGECGGRAPS